MIRIWPWSEIARLKRQGECLREAVQFEADRGLDLLMERNDVAAANRTLSDALIAANDEVATLRAQVAQAEGIGREDVSEEETITLIAITLCEADDREPLGLEPGSVIVHPTDDLERWESADGVFLDTLADNGTRPPDGLNRKGEKCRFNWRLYIGKAQAVAQALADAKS